MNIISIHEPLVVVTTIFLLSLFAAFVLFKFLKNNAHIKTAYGIFGGAIAGFIAIFALLTYTYHGLPRDSLDPQFKIPQGFSRFVSRDYKIGFGYPESLALGRSPMPVPLVIGALDTPDKGLLSISVLPFKVSVLDYLRDKPSSRKELEELLRSIMPVIRCRNIKEYSISGVTGVLAELEHTKEIRKHAPLKQYSLMIAHPTHNFTYFISFSASNTEFDKAKIVFENILSMVSFLE